MAENPPLLAEKAADLRSASARVIQVDAHLALGEDAAALEQLDAFAARDFRGAPRAAELRVLRGELLVRARRFPEAIAAFEPALKATAGGDLYERALYGRAASRAALGDEAGSATDLRRYLDAFPRTVSPPLRDTRWANCKVRCRPRSCVAEEQCTQSNASRSQHGSPSSHWPDVPAGSTSEAWTEGT